MSARARTATIARAASTTIVCDLYLRLSDGRNENGSFEAREASLRTRAAQLGWTVNRVVIENDMMNGSKSASAFKRRKMTLPDGTKVERVWRPGFQSMLDDLTSGRVNAILAEDLDRTMRDPRDAQDLIDVIRDCRGNARSLSGSLTLTDGGTDAEILMTEVMVSVGRKSSADNSRRVAAGRKRTAEAGKFGGGRRPYGFGPDGLTVCEHEASVIQWMAERVINKQSLRSIAFDLNKRGEPTVTGALWTPSMIKEILIRRRNIARMTHLGEDAGPAPWAPILKRGQHDAVLRRIAGTDRSDSRPGPAPNRLLSGIAHCPCGETLEAGPRHTYRCRALRSGPSGGGHVRRDAAALDAYVGRLVVECLSNEDTFRLHVKASRPDIDVDGLTAEAKILRARLEDLGADYADGVITREVMRAGSQRLQAKIDAIEATLASAHTTSAVTRLVSPVNPLAHLADTAIRWGQLPLGDRRAIVRELAIVTVLPTGQTDHTVTSDDPVVQAYLEGGIAVKALAKRFELTQRETHRRLVDAGVKLRNPHQFDEDAIRVTWC